MAGYTLKSIQIAIFILFSIIILSLEAVYHNSLLASLTFDKDYIYNKAVRQTLTKLDLKTIEGKWHCLYQRRPIDQYGFCSQLDIIADENYVNVTQSNGNQIVREFKLEQNEHLEGKIDEVKWIRQGPESVARRYPWFVIQTEPNLVVYQVMTTNGTKDNWSIYGRQPNLDNKLPDFRIDIDKLIDAGIYADESGEVGYQCSDQREKTGTSH